MLQIALGGPGSFCDNCAAPATKGYELRSPLSAQFFCTTCAERKFGERETSRAMEKAKASAGPLLNALGMLAQPPRDPPMQKPMGFLRRDEREAPGPSHTTIASRGE